LYNKKIAKKKHVAREEAKVVRKKGQVEKAAQIAAKKAANNTKKLLPAAQTNKRKASQAFSPKHKRQKRSGGVAAHAESLEAAPAAPPKVNSRGRTTTVPSKYR
jgi:hypothetical protein